MSLRCSTVLIRLPSPLLCTTQPDLYFLSLHPLPPSHFGYTRLVLGNLAAWSHGACVVYPAQIYDPPAIVEALAAERCTALHGVPTHFLGVLSEVLARRAKGEAVDTRTLRWEVLE